jgi:hypothetical protein
MVYSKQVGEALAILDFVRAQRNVEKELRYLMKMVCILFPKNFLAAWHDDKINRIS